MKSNNVLNNLVSRQVPRGTASRTLVCTSTCPPTNRKRWSASCRREGAGAGGSWAQHWAMSPNSLTCLGVERPPLTRSSLTGPRKKAPLWDCCALRWPVSRGLMWWQLWTAPRRVPLWCDSLYDHTCGSHRLKWRTLTEMTREALFVSTSVSVGDFHRQSSFGGHLSLFFFFFFY